MDNVAFHVFGVDIDEGNFKGALLEFRRKQVIVKKLTFENVKPLYIKEDPLVITSLNSSDLLVKELNFPRTNKQNILTTLNFQVEGFLPFALEDAALQFYPLEIQKKRARYLSISTKRENVKKHLEECAHVQLEPEIISCHAIALLEVCKYLVFHHETNLLLHLQKKRTELLLLNGGSFLGFKYIDSGSDDLTCPEQIKKWQKEIEKIYFSMQLENTPIHVLGESFQSDAFLQSLQKDLPYTLHKAQAKPSLGVTQNELLTFAIPIGLGLNGLPNTPYQINFCEKKNLPSPFKRLKKPLLNYFILSLIFSFLVGSIEYFLLYKQTNDLKTKATHLLEWKNAFFKLHEKEPKSDPVYSIEDLLNELEKLESSFSYPYNLNPNVSKVSDFLYWLNKMPFHESIHIEKLSYSLVKYPSKATPSTPYSVKVELEFKSPSEKLLKEIENKLREPNEMYYHDKEFKIQGEECTCKLTLLLKNKPLSKAVS